MAALFDGVDSKLEIILEMGLTNVFVESERAEGNFELFFLGVGICDGGFY